jgi:hypothetical protein
MAGFRQDLRFALRMLVRNPGFTLVALVTLALGIGAGTAMFSVLNAVLLRPLPYEDAGRLVLMWETSPELPTMSVAYPDFVDWRLQSQAFEGLAAYNRFHSMNLTGTEIPERLSTALISAHLLDVLRQPPALGRGFTAEDDQVGAEPVVILGHALWERRFASDPGVVGQMLTLDGRGHTVVGVMPEGYRFPSGVEIWVPLGQFVDEGMLDRGNHPGLFVVGRLAPGVELEQAQSEMETIGMRLEESYPDSNTGVRAGVVPLREVLVRGIRPTLMVLFGAVGFVLLIGAGLMMKSFLQLVQVNPGFQADGLLTMQVSLPRQSYPDGPALQRFHQQVTEQLASIPGVTSAAVVNPLPFGPGGWIYIPYRQHPEQMREVSLILRSDLDPGSLTAAARDAVLAVDPNQPVFGAQPMADLVAASTSQRRFAFALMGTFAGVGLFLALAGIYGVMAFLAARRTREFGVRMALGARPPDILRMMVGQGVRLAVIGLVLGIAGALALHRVMAGMLFQVSATDPLIFAVLSLIMVAVVALASLVPALRAARVDPMVALRYA